MNALQVDIPDEAQQLAVDKWSDGEEYMITIRQEAGKFTLTEIAEPEPEAEEELEAEAEMPAAPAAKPMAEHMPTEPAMMDAAGEKMPMANRTNPQRTVMADNPAIAIVIAAGKKKKKPTVTA